MTEFAGKQSGKQAQIGGPQVQARSAGKQTLVEQAAPDAISEPIQLRASHPTQDAGDGAANEDIRALASRGVATARTSLPYFDVVQAAFGHHDLSGLVAHAGQDASETADKMGANGYTAGRHVVLGLGSDLFTVAHEATHFIEQQHGLVALAGGVGAEGDLYEQHANAVAARVVGGQSVEAMLDQYVGTTGGTKLATVDSGPVQQQKSELAANREAKVPAKLDNARGFERKLGIAAFSDGRAHAAASTMIARLLSAVMPSFDEARASDQAAYGELFGRENLGDNDPDRANGAWSAGQVGTDYAVLHEALTNGNLREKMTGIYNASLGGFKATVKWLMEEDRNEIVARGLDDRKLERRRNQMKHNPAAKDLYRDPGNPLDRKKYSSYEYTGTTRIPAVGDEQKSKRTLGELDGDGIGLSDREKQFQYGTAAVPDASPVKWKEGGTFFNVNNDNKWVKKYQEKLLMPVTAGPSGTAMRMFTAWEFLAKPTSNVDFRLALLGWMLTGNDHSFHEIMATSADFGLPYTAGVDAYRHVDPYTEGELRAIAAPEGFPDEENYRTSHVTAQLPSPAPLDPRIKGGPQASVLTTPAQVSRFNTLLAGGAFPGIDGGAVAQAMALLVYTDDRASGPEGVSAFEFINNVLKGHENSVVMYYFIQKDPQLKEAYHANKFKLRELVAEAKEHARYAQQGLALLPVFGGDVYRGYKTNSLPTVGQAWTEAKFLSMSRVRGTSEGFATNPEAKGKYSILVTMVSVTGREVGQSSMFGAGEAEVLFAPGTRFRVLSAPVRWPAGGPNGYTVQWQEV